MTQELSELLTHCIRCGFCLESCPTFVTTASELESPRGRIYLVRSATEGKLNWTEDVKPHLDLCLGCRACEPACPSGVQYGAILELARDEVESRSPSISKSMLLRSTTSPSILKAQLKLGRYYPGRRMPGFASVALSGAKPEADLPTEQKPGTLPELKKEALPPIKGEVYFLEGCAMRVLYSRVNECSKRLLRRAGFVVREVPQGCCGALHAHNGHLKEAQKLGAELCRAMPDDLPVIVNSAGCGSTMKDYKNLLDKTEGAAGFAKRVFDLSEFLQAQEFEKHLQSSHGIPGKVAYHEACHLVHGQRISEAPKRLLESVPGLTLIPFAEADMCCGSAGIYNLTQPKMARQLLDRKWDNIEEAKPDLVALANPGCHSWIAQASNEHGGYIPVLHIAEVLEASFIGLESFGLTPKRNAHTGQAVETIA